MSHQLLLPPTSTLLEAFRAYDKVQPRSHGTFVMDRAQHGLVTFLPFDGLLTDSAGKVSAKCNLGMVQDYHVTAWSNLNSMENPCVVRDCTQTLKIRTLVAAAGLKHELFFWCKQKIEKEFVDQFNADPIAGTRVKNFQELKQVINEKTILAIKKQNVRLLKEIVTRASMKKDIDRLARELQEKSKIQYKTQPENGTKKGFIRKCMTVQFNEVSRSFPKYVRTMLPKDLNNVKNMKDFDFTKAGKELFALYCDDRQMKLVASSRGLETSVLAAAPKDSPKDVLDTEVAYVRTLMHPEEKKPAAKRPPTVVTPAKADVLDTEVAYVRTLMHPEEKKPAAKRPPTVVTPAKAACPTGVVTKDSPKDVLDTEVTYVRTLIPPEMKIGAPTFLTIPRSNCSSQAVYLTKESLKQKQEEKEAKANAKEEEKRVRHLELIASRNAKAEKDAIALKKRKNAAKDATALKKRKSAAKKLAQTGTKKGKKNNDTKAIIPEKKEGAEDVCEFEHCKFEPFHDRGYCNYSKFKNLCCFKCKITLKEGMKESDNVHICVNEKEHSCGLMMCFKCWYAKLNQEPKHFTRSMMMTKK